VSSHSVERERGLLAPVSRCSNCNRLPAVLKSSVNTIPRYTFHMDETMAKLAKDRIAMAPGATKVESSNMNLEVSGS
jgi:hypothetical protein